MTLREQLQRDEGLMLFPYRDSRGLLTIGYGRCIEKVGISKEEAEFLLENDIATARRAVLAHIPMASALDEVRFGVLVQMAFNLGIMGLLQFHRMLAALAREDWADTAREMLDSRWAQQVGDRAVRLARQMESGA